MNEEDIRKEWKHIITHIQFYRIRNELETFLTPDSHQGGNGYQVRSLYFDTLGKKDLRANLDGILSRCKLRLRTYPGGESLYKLELKCKQGFDSTKRFLLLTESEARLIVRSDDAFLLNKTNPLAAEIFQMIHCHGYRPQLVVEYTREAYEHIQSRTRITFDRSIRSSRIAEDFFSAYPVGTLVLPQQKGVLEVKYDRVFPTHLKGILARIGIRPQAYSKYVHGQLNITY